MKKVLLIGDSIRISYQDEVARLLEGEAEVFVPLENCRYSKFVLWGMHSWLEKLGNPELDVVHWNAGIWDLHRVTADGEVFTPPDEYVYYTNRLYVQMKHTAKKQIWASTTPSRASYIVTRKGGGTIIQAEERERLTSEDWNRDVAEYNRLAMQTLTLKGDVVFNDIHGLIQLNRDEYISEDGIHLTTLGARKAAEQVAESIRRQLW